MNSKVENKKYFGFTFVKSKKTEEPPGDHLWLDIKQKSIRFILCDGVSSSSSDSASSQLVVKNLADKMLKKRSVKTFKSEFPELVNTLNKKMLSENLSSTVCLFNGGDAQNFVACAGDSALVIRDQQKNIIYYNNIYNLKHSSEGIFSKTDDQREHIITTCLGIANLRLEICSDIKLEKGFEILSFSDGLVQYVKSVDEAFAFTQELINGNADLFKEPNFDDVSIVYIKIKE